MIDKNAMHVVFITPWPPQKTGIGDYAFDLISELSKYNITIHVLSDCENPVRAENIEVFNINRLDPKVLKDYDLINYQLGNNIHFNLYMLELVKNFGGVVHLHDMVLHHTMAWVTWSQGDIEGYLSLIQKWYGYNVSELVRKLLDMKEYPWNHSIVTDIPLFEEIIQYADACIVHSKFAKWKVKNAFPALDTYLVKQVLKGMGTIKKNNNNHINRNLKIGIFGGIDPRKNVDTILKALSDVLEETAAWEAHLVGETDDNSKNISVLPEKLGLSKNVIFHGRVDLKEFKTLMGEMDFFISLRYPTVGETSGIVVRAMQRGIPVIVSDIGWFGELPEFVDKVPVVGMKTCLSRIIRKYICQENYLNKKKKQFANYAKKKLNYSDIVKGYYNILVTEHKKQSRYQSLQIAFVTPWPPQYSGIADYAYDLISQLSEIYRSIHIYTNCKQPQKISGTEIFVIDSNNLPDLSKYDTIIFQVGNNSVYHLYMLDLIKKYRGIVQLHDVVLHNMIALYARECEKSYFPIIKKWYGVNVSLLCEELVKRGQNIWDTDVVIDIPLFEEFIQYADACIVHSEFAKEKVQDKFHELSIYKIDQIYSVVETLEKKATPGKNLLKFGIFGRIEPNKHLMTIIKAFSGILRINSDCELHVVGDTGEYYRNIYEFIRNHGIDKKIIFYGKTGDVKFHKLMSEMDLIISLRFPTMGETSAIVMKAMQMGIPVIVNDIGWYAELPDFVDKLSVKNMHENLLSLLLKYITEKDYLEKKKEKSIEYSQEHLNADKFVKDYLKILAIEYRRKTNCKALEIITDLIHDLNIDDDFFLQNTIKKLDIIF